MVADVGRPPIRGEEYCLFHSPEREEDAAEARRLGGLRRRREKTVIGACHFEGLDSVAAIRRILEIGPDDYVEDEVEEDGVLGASEPESPEPQPLAA